MKAKLSLFALAILVLILYCCTPHKTEQAHHKFRNFDCKFPPPPGEKNWFVLSQDYPDTFDVNEKYPWTGINFKTDYSKYMKAVLAYCIEGNIPVDFKVQDNKVRKWYHAPWLDFGLNGREYHHGLTRERPLPAHELAQSQDSSVENWAVGFYNAKGGYTMGKVWDSDSIPVMELASFPQGTVTFKLLFTNAPVTQLPFLEGSKEWTANIYKCNADKDTNCAHQRYDAEMRLLQIDIAVKDSQAGPAGWVFGTFLYDGSQPGTTVWERIVPVGLMFGDDSGVDTLIDSPGAFRNPSLKQTVLNEDLICPSCDTARNNKKAFMKHHGLGGRLNGPVDNPISSCISCHSKAANTDSGAAAPMANFSLTRDKFPLSDFRTYFAEVHGGSGTLDFNGKKYNKLDYSQQLSVGVRNFYQAKIDTANKNCKTPQPNLPESSRGGAQPK